jgi:hypothetical protein
MLSITSRQEDLWRAGLGCRELSNGERQAPRILIPGKRERADLIEVSSFPRNFAQLCKLPLLLSLSNS